MTYKEQIQHPKWQKKRLEILQRDNFTCKFCGTKEKQLHVHHLIYHKNKMIWEYENKYLITYCSKCHNSWHKEMNEVKELIAVDIFELSMFKTILETIRYFKIRDTVNINDILKSILLISLK